METKGSDEAANRRFRDLFSSLSATTSMHGVVHLKTARSGARRVVWSCILLLAMGMLIWQMSVVFTKYLNYPKATSVSLKYSPELTFPAVTICNMNPIRKSVVHHLPPQMRKVADVDGNTATGNGTGTASLSDREKRMAGFGNTVAGINPPTPTGGTTQNTTSASSGSSDKDITGSFKKPSKRFKWSNNKTQHVTSSRFSERETFNQYYAGMTKEEQKAYGHNISWLLLSCTMGGFKCYPSDFQHFHNNLYGNCYVFNWGGVNQTRHKTATTGPLYGLNMELYIEHGEYIDTSHESGVRFIVHNQRDMPFPEDAGFSAKPGTSTYVNIQRKEIMRALAPYGNCVKMSKGENIKRNAFLPLLESTAYSRKACQKTCYQQHVIRQCACADFMYPFRGPPFENLTSGTIHPCDNNKHEEKLCMATIKSNFSKGYLECHTTCPPPCFEVYFANSISSAGFPSDSYQKRLMQTIMQRDTRLRDRMRVMKHDAKLGFIQNNVLKLQIYYQELHYGTIVTAPSYTVTDFLSDLGGQMALWLGVSMIAAFEFMEFFVDLIRLIFAKCCQKKKQKVHTAKENTNVFMGFINEKTT